MSWRGDRVPNATGALTLELLQKAADDMANQITVGSHGPMTYPVSWETYTTMQQMPGGPTWENYMKLLFE